VMTFVDTPGAYPGVGAEERGQSEAIGRNLYVMAELRVPVVVTYHRRRRIRRCAGDCGRDVTLMLQYSIYSVISPEGCASILWKSADKAPDAAETLGITANRLKTLGLVDSVVASRSAARTATRRHDADAAQGAAGRLAEAQEEADRGAYRDAFRTPDGLRQVQGGRGS